VDVRVADAVLAAEVGQVLADAADPRVAPKQPVVLTDGLHTSAPHAVVLVEPTHAACTEAFGIIDAGAVLCRDRLDALPLVLESVASHLVVHDGRAVDLAATGPQLDRRHRAILDAVLTGLPNPAIADALGLSLATTKRSVADLFEAFGVHGRTALLCEALRHGYLPALRPVSTDGPGRT
jgi:DNA-binding CsgD family transcriptional regulator